MSLSNSAGILLGPGYHFDLVRPGIALYGGNPRAVGDNPMRPVAHFEARVLQVHTVSPGRQRWVRCHLGCRRAADAGHAGSGLCRTDTRGRLGTSRM